MLNDDLGFDDGREGARGGPLSHAIVERDKSVFNMVRRSVQTGNLALAYQPVVRAGQPDQVAFLEGLIRIMDERGRVIPAADFIGKVEDHELGRQIDCASIELGLRALDRNPGLRLSINMSARSIGYPRWKQILKHGLVKSPTIGERLILEITESSAMSMPEIVISFMTELQRHGISFALDDFGAGYTAFRFLKDFLFDIIKIDGQFINGIAQNTDNQVLTKALVSIARHFDMFTVAECVESQDDLVMLQHIGVDCLQGYFIGSPSLKHHLVTPATHRPLRRA